MNLLQRFGYFSIGLFFGIVILIFFLSGKNTSCSYFPNARVLSKISSKHRAYTPEALKFLHTHNIDTTAVSKILKNGEVDFGNSITDRDSCNLYSISGKTPDTIIQFKVENCDSIATIQNINFFKEE
ncbi:hypothetical protein [Zunongwangia sp.]|uniref:hypothetical protein n=1 Tax=Zunongwangia sp. TaxID=1965325 RepID=UPI003AA8E4A1